MLRITRCETSRATTLKLEGKLSDLWVGELERCWRERVPHHQEGIVIDITEVTFIDADGKALLMQLWREGAEFLTAGCLNTSIIEEITMKRPKVERKG
jgi:anti-anti-sigma regulatory factor